VQESDNHGYSGSYSGSRVDDHGEGVSHWREVISEELGGWGNLCVFVAKLKVIIIVVSIWPNGWCDS
jgi:hypothetical protein